MNVLPLLCYATIEKCIVLMMRRKHFIVNNKNNSNNINIITIWTVNKKLLLHSFVLLK